MAAGFTPPGSILEPPLTPPSTVENVVNCLRLHRAGHRLRSWWEHRLRPNVYAQLLHALDADEPLRNYVEDKMGVSMRWLPLTSIIKRLRERTITVWRPEYKMVDGVEEFQATAVVEAKPFRTDAGCAVERTELRLSLRDFATDELSQGQRDLDREIFLTSKSSFVSFWQVPKLGSRYSATSRLNQPYSTRRIKASMTSKRRPNN
ncbi:hypothetical protein N7468_006249 [Penicillium chermesinum]|uniref:Uncharacterized protein n=1 Tax=Penicillium chermesinum TaxID=63820 RepID=A0A9W9NUQ1_9EURO|nr:uncharacterized protein N7468_006249 [Penicillium chermesinum]KAJ5225024.1 hypothetical protein N7468_006249 [Penicillium chermesinum]KAJ6151753.1 hypothetical protein N7470_006881 [Penicillium chermesinum]